MSHFGGHMMQKEIWALNRTGEVNRNTTSVVTSSVSEANGQPEKAKPARNEECAMKSVAIHHNTSSRSDCIGPQLGAGNSFTTNQIATPLSPGPSADASVQSESSGETDQRASSEETTSNTSGGDQKDSSEDDGKHPSKTRSTVKKLDRSKLRKGKWTAEEEEYTSRIIHHFSTGILTLPEGTTLRSYLAEQLNCDPMRITKKYAGASCLGKRIYHLSDRAPATVADIEMAKAELAQLEHRFRLRVEYSQSGVPLPPRTDFLPGASAMFSQPWLLGLAAMNASALGAFQLPPAPIGVHGVLTGLSSQLIAPNSQLIAPNSLTPTAPQARPGIPRPAPNEALTTWAWVQAAASLSPALSQLAAANIQQHHRKLQKVYDDQLQAAAGHNAMCGTAPPQTPVRNVNGQASRVAAIKAAANQSVVYLMVEAKEASTTDSLMVEAKEASELNSKKSTSGTCSPRSEEDEAAGSMLMGFLSSLRKGYEDALKDKDSSEKESETSEKQSLSGQKRPASEMKPKKTRGPGARRVTPAPSTTTTERMETLSGTTSYRADSSLEDFMSSSGTDKGKDPSSSEESDKDSSGGRGSSEDQPSSEDQASSEERGSSEERSSGPPRKRMKGKGMVGEFTKKNIAKHNHRMDAMRSRLTTNRPVLGSSRNQRTGRED